MIAKFHILCFACLLAVYLLVFVGGTVRSTGSGMGCPDWPTCFGRWIPPTSIGQLPVDYKAMYSAYRHEKNIRFARYLSFIGASSVADQLLNDESVLQEADFNVLKTWIEYINRLLGMLVGLLFVVLALFSFRFRKKHTALFLLSWVGLLLVGFQGWFGSIVVSTNLTSWTVTIHMFLALLIVILLACLVAMSKPLSSCVCVRVPSLVYWFLGACALVLLIQTFLGTTVRTAIDAMALSDTPRAMWVERLGNSFIVHRSFSLLLLLLHGVLFYFLYKLQLGGWLPRFLIVITLIALLSGGAMAYLGIPFLLQPLHLTLAMVLFGIQGYLFCRLKFCFSFVSQ